MPIVIIFYWIRVWHIYYAKPEKSTCTAYQSNIVWTDAILLSGHLGEVFMTQTRGQWTKLVAVVHGTLDTELVVPDNAVIMYGSNVRDTSTKVGGNV